MDPGEMTGSVPSKASGSGSSNQAKAEKGGGNDIEEESLVQVGDPAGRQCNTSTISGVGGGGGSRHVDDGNSSTTKNSLQEYALNNPLKHKRDELLDTKNKFSTSDTVVAPISQRDNSVDKAQGRHPFQHGGNEVNDQGSSSAPAERPEDDKFSLKERQQDQNPFEHRKNEVHDQQILSASGKKPADKNSLGEAPKGENPFEHSGNEVDDREISAASGKKPADEYSLDKPQGRNPIQHGVHGVDSFVAPDNKTVVISSENIDQRRANNYSYNEAKGERNPYQHENKELDDQQEQDSSTPDNH
ncbi:hypothetical protein Ddye_022071 [Dipteronia dyeriana]|uniref:Uncharacterized protein n=1 Tax=Dipteronia dyeriana TaxID=168575 RepID=A0AAD9WXG7_9ROSI|nr:hypothetical protein Ddye_022071 [Dipteronia dyeriana]